MRGAGNMVERRRAGDLQVLVLLLWQAQHPNRTLMETTVAGHPVDNITPRKEVPAGDRVENSLSLLPRISLSEFPWFNWRQRAPRSLAHHLCHDTVLQCHNSDRH